MGFLYVEYGLAESAPQSVPDIPARSNDPVIVIGGGPVGMRAANEIARRGHAVTVLAAESFQPYNRVKLTPLLAGDVQFGEIETPRANEGSGRLTCRTGIPVVRIDRDNRRVRGADGTLWPYSKLVIATGSRAFVPAIPGHDLPGVYTFRTAADASALLARSFSARRVIVIGGGLLGLEAARGMRKRQAHVTVIEHEGRVMPRQLDTEAGALLADKIKALGVSVQTGVAVKQIDGAGKVETVHLASGEVLPCDTVIVCTGVRANTGLALDAGLPIGRGIVVNDRMQTADPHIFAVGECAEHAGLVYGLVGPGYEQADTAAAVIAGEAAAYGGSLPATKLKVIGAEVFSAGQIEQLEVAPGVRSHVWRGDGQYRRIFIRNGKLAGAIAIGTWHQASQAQNGVQDGATVYPWMLYRFRRTGLLWPEEALSVAELPASATLCNCTGVTCGRLRDSMAAGATSADALSLATGAGSVCGTCKPLLEELVNAGGPPKPVRLFRPILALSVLAALAALVLSAAPRVPFPDQFTTESLAQWLWRDNIVKQWTGYILLGLTVAALLIGLRKRLRVMDRLGSFDLWRLVHLAIGLLAAAGLFLHTGLRPGANLNLALFTAFTATLIFGALSGLTTGGDHALRARRIGTARKPARRLPTWVHIVAVWPLPVLLLVHVLTVYAF
jgi:nitrite reductase (NADH) large subunit